jgi:protein SCO1
MEPEALKPMFSLRLLRNFMVALGATILAFGASFAERHGLNLTPPSFAQEISNVAAVDAIGGPFTLVDQNGITRTDADFRGRYMLIYFGYTYCPDICPTALMRNSDALDILGEQADSIVPILISVDWQRDTPKQIKDYVGFFHPRFVGLTGSEEQLDSAAKAYRVYYSKMQLRGADEDEYVMDHSSVTYLMGPDGRFLSHFLDDVTPEAMAESIRGFLQKQR